MLYLKHVAFSLLFIALSCNSGKRNQERIVEETKHTYTNALIHESSPYLLQHAHNPVNWYPWGKEALDKAKRENKLILISIGYSACHWCHVMEHESFEDTTVANYMNANFVSIKIDREERPDIDQIYMDAIHLLSGRGGWPLNCFALPDGKPFFGGTYFPKNKWMELLESVQNYKVQNPNKLEEQANQLTQGIVNNDHKFIKEELSEITKEDLKQLVDHWKTQIDYKKGGLNRAPKFPIPTGYQFLLQYAKANTDMIALEAVDVTLTKMAEGGIYDQIGGGFARYSTDEDWKAPHFEKMLYDNAQLLSLYSEAYRYSKNPLYKTIVKETSEFIERELRSKSGGVFSSLDADSEGEEGKFYVWTKTELNRILKNQPKAIQDYYSVKSSGNWEHGNNILHIKKSKESILKTYNLTEIQFTQALAEAKTNLLKARAKRVRPGLDDKILTAWNGLLIKGYTDAYKAFGEEKYLNLAIETAQFVKENILKSDFRLDRNFKNGESSINGFLDDYAFTISGFISLYQTTFNEEWLNTAKALNSYVDAHFSDQNSPYYFYTSDLDPALIARKKVIADNVIPAGNSEMAKNNFVLGHYFYNTKQIKHAETMAAGVKDNALRGGAYYANWDQLFMWMINEPYEVAIVGKDAKQQLKEWNTHYLPNAFVLGGQNEGTLDLLKNKWVNGQTTIYVCKNKACQLPVTQIKDAIKLIK